MRQRCWVCSAGFYTKRLRLNRTIVRFNLGVTIRVQLTLNRVEADGDFWREYSSPIQPGSPDCRQLRPASDRGERRGVETFKAREPTHRTECDPAGNRAGM